MFEKLVSFTKDVSDLADKPALGSAAALKAQFDAAPDEVRVYLNKLIEALQKTTAGDSGAKNIGVTSISGLTGSDVQTILESLNTTKVVKTQETTFKVALNGGATVSEGRGIQAFKDTLGLVHVSMDFDLPSNVNTAWHIATLPEGYRPAVKITQNISAANSSFGMGYGEISIQTDGKIMIGTPITGSWRYFHVNIPAFKTV
jgi:hypothetical protein